MSTEENVKRQLADYFGWLEGHVGSDMRPTGTPAQRNNSARWLGRGMALVGVAAVIALVAVVINRDDDPGRVVPATTADETVPVTTIPPTTVPVTTVPESDATTWAPVNLPAGMSIVDVSSATELPGVDVPLAVQFFAHVASDGTTLDQTLSLIVSDSDLSPPPVATGEVHGLPVSFGRDDATGTIDGWWIEHNLRIELRATGLGLQDIASLLDQTTWRADAKQGFDPQSIAGAMSLLYENVGPRPFTTFVVKTESGYVTVEDNGRASSPSFTSAEEVPGVGRLLRSSWISAVITDDGSVLTISPTMLNGSTVEAPSDPLDVAQSLAHVNERPIAARAAAARARESTLPEVGRVTVGANEVVLRGGTVELPEALCVVVSGVEGCTFNPVIASSDPGWSTAWLTAGEAWLFVTSRFGPVDPAIARICLTDANGAVGDELPYDETVDGDRAYTVTQIPAGANYAVMCGRNNPIDALPTSSFQTIVQRPSA